MSAIAFLFAYGPEVRAFLASGLVDEVAGQSPVVAISPLAASSMLASRGLPTIEIPACRESALARRVRAYADSIFVKRLERYGASKWRHQISSAPRSSPIARMVRGFLSGDSPLRTVTTLQRWIARWGAIDSDLERSLQAYNVTRLFYSAYNDSRTDVVIRTAIRAGVKVILVPNSWKDVFVRPRISPVPAELWTGDEATGRMFCELNPDLLHVVVRPIESLHLKAVHRRRGEISRAEYCQRVGLDPSKPFVCYTTAAPNAILREEFLVKALAESLAQLRPGGIQLLVRLNPMEVGVRFERLLGEIPWVRIQRPAWDWIPEADWCAASDEDTKLWAATLEHMHINVSLPSTVTLEAISFGKSVINIGFDFELDLPLERSAIRYWRGCFYERFHDDPRVLLAESLGDLAAKINDSLSRNRRDGLNNGIEDWRRE